MSSKEMRLKARIFQEALQATSHHRGSKEKLTDIESSIKQIAGNDVFSCSKK